MLKDAIIKLTLSESLDRTEAELAMGEIMDGAATETQIGAFLASLKLKGETMAEVVGCARALRTKAKTVECGQVQAIDVCGTGGDGPETFNVSTTSAFVIAAGGVPVAKHGNRAVSSRCGSADLLEILGINIHMGPRAVEACLRETGMTFMFAPLYHPAMKNAAGPRKELGFRTVFNLLGPLCNPAQVNAQVVGVCEPELTELLAASLAELGVKHALVVHSQDGLDELSLSAPSLVSEVRDRTVSTYVVDPEQLRLTRATLDQVVGGNSRLNARIFASVLRGEKTPYRDMVLLNSAAGLLVGGSAGDLPEGIHIAERAINSGAAWEKYEQVRSLSWELE